MERKLFQVSWLRGQTDGDQIQGSVGLLKNARSESHGRLGPRPILTDMQVVAAAAQEHVRIKGDPMNTGATHWDFYIGPTSISATSSEGTAKSFDVSDILPENIDVPASSFSAADFGVVCSLWGVSGAFLGIYFIKVIKASGGFRALPTAYSFVGTPLETGDQDTTEESNWTMVKPSTERPELAVFYDELSGPGGFIGEYTGGQRPTCVALDYQGDNTDIPTNDVEQKIEALRGEAAGYIGADHNRVAVIATKMVDPGGLYGRSFTVKLVAQYVFEDGSVSLPSEPVTISASATWPESNMRPTPDHRYSLCLQLYKNMNADPTIREVRIYRKVVDAASESLEASDDFDLILTAPLYEDEDDPLHREVSAAVEYQQVPDGNESNDLNDHLVRMDRPYGLFTSASGAWKPFDLLDFEDAQVERNSSSTYQCKGWARISGGNQVCQYLDDHYYSQGDFGFRIKEYIGNWFRYGVVGAKLIHSSKTGGNLGTAVQGGRPWMGVSLPANAGGGGWTAPIALGVPATSESYLYYVVQSMPQNYFYLGGAITQIGSNFYVTNRGQNLYSSATEVYVNPHSAYSLPMVYTVDIGYPTIDTLGSVLGADEEDLIYPSVKQVLRIGGRIFGLNVAYGDKTYQSRLVYTPQARAVFSKNNYWDYSKASEGAGVGLLIWHSFLCCFFEDSVGVLDISGGSDFTFKQAAYTEGVGPHNSRAFCATPAGVFWAGEHIHVFDGKAIGNVSEMPSSGISIIDTYRSIVTDPALVRVNYYEYDEEVWVSCGTKAIVLNVRTMAWRYYELEEVEGSSIVGMESDPSGDYAFLDDGANMVRTLINQQSTGGITFEWGVEFDISLSAPEVVKKAKRLYVTLAQGAAGTFRVQADGDFSQQIIRDEINIPAGQTKRISTSMRGRVPRYSVMVTGGSTWQTRIDSIGLSYKLKRVR